MNVIEVKDLEKKFKDVKAVAGLNFSVERGEIFGLIGPDGAGKTTTLRILSGIMLPGGGLVNVLGKQMPKAAEAVKEKIGYMCQKFSLYTDLTINENISFFADIYGIDKKTLNERLGPLLKMTRLEPFKDRLAGKLSGGMKQKLALICTLIHRPEILFLDEPTTGVDPVSRREFWEILQSIHSEGVTIVVSTPYMDEAEQCSRIGLMFKGKIILIDTPKNMRKNLKGVVVEIITTGKEELVINTIKKSNYIKDWQQLGERFHVILKDEVAADDFCLKLCNEVTIRRIAASVEDVFVEKIKQ
ncbi:MAG: ABC transporter ATP-binding protein [bacterium]